MHIKLADLIFRIHTLYDYTPHFCREYVTDQSDADITISISESDILAEERAIEMPDYAESLAVYRKIAEEMLYFDGFLMHGAVIEAYGKGVAFLARSGVGKSTHVNLWKQLLGDDMRVINGDKPLIRFRENVPYAYGTPWAGKERLQTNGCVPLTCVCFLERSEENAVMPMEEDEILLSLLPQIYMPKESEKMELLFSHLSRFIDSCRFYRLRCNMDIDAARTCYTSIFGVSE